MHKDQYLSFTCVSTLALSINVFASAIKPLIAQPEKREIEIKKYQPQH